MMLALEDAASYGPKSAMVLFKPVDKHGSEVADKSVMTSTDSGSDLDQETARFRTSGRVLRTRRRRWREHERSESARAVVLEPDAAGIDIGAEEIYVAVPPDRDEDSIRRFSSFTCDLHALADWLVQCRVRTVAMESTGVTGSRCFRFWKPEGWKSIWSTLIT
jgi:hypothetical protein